MKLPADLPPEAVTVLIDSREQQPWNLDPLRAEPGTLATGDYSIRGCEHMVALERKSLPDLLACCGRERERFDREIQRLLAYPCRALIVESNWREIEAGEWRSQLTPKQVIGSLCSWLGQGVPVLMADDHARAGRLASRLLYSFARRRWRELRQMASGVETEAPTRKPKRSRNAPKAPATAFAVIPEDAQGIDQ